MVGESLENKFALRSSLEAKIESIWRAFRDVVAGFETETAETRKEMERLTAKDAVSCEEVSGKLSDLVIYKVAGSGPAMGIFFLPVKVDPRQGTL